MKGIFGRFIRARRIELRVTQRDIAVALGIHSADFVSLVELGRRRFDLNRIPTLASTLEVDAAELCRLALEDWQPQFFAALTSHELI